MISWFRDLDGLLRGRKTGPDLLREDAAALPLRTFLSLALVLGLVYGFFMGWYAIASREPANYSQVLASTVKMPALFLLTLAVTFPSLYVFSALIGCRLSFMAVLRLLVATIVINLAIAASLGPILGFFTLSTKSYSFMIILNVVLLAIAGFVALGFLLATLRKLADSTEVRTVVTVPPEPSREPEFMKGEAPSSGTSAPRPPPPRQTVVVQREGSAYGIFYIWVIIYGLVGAQMGWILRPFVGNPGVPFEWFRARSGNFFQAVFEQLQTLMGNPPH
jgi:hypothetical protein